MVPWPLGWSEILGTGSLWTGWVSQTWKKCCKSPCSGGSSVTPWVFTTHQILGKGCALPQHWLLDSLYWDGYCEALPVVLPWLPLELLVGASAWPRKRVCPVTRGPRKKPQTLEQGPLHFQSFRAIPQERDWGSVWF